MVWQNPGPPKKSSLPDPPETQVHIGLVHVRNLSSAPVRTVARAWKTKNEPVVHNVPASGPKQSIATLATTTHRTTQNLRRHVPVSLPFACWTDRLYALSFFAFVPPDFAFVPPDSVFAPPGRYVVTSDCLRI